MSGVKKHGQSNSSVYRTWARIKQKTRNPKTPNYKKYGAKGIDVCDEWFNSFVVFFDYVGEKPFPKATIDRIDNSKGYEPGKVRWATYKEQENNRTNNRIIDIDGVKLTVSQWADKAGISYRVILTRLRMGWTVKDAVSLPISKLKYKNRSDKEK